MTTPHVPVAVLGAGFAGIGASVALERAGQEHLVFERASALGGTWRDNTYPGCRCDVPSHLYSFSFALNPEWSETYSPQPEIWAYMRDVAKRFDVERRIRFDHAIEAARWNPGELCWELETSRGRFTAGALLCGNGPLAEPRDPAIEGLESFEGVVMHSARWRSDVDLENKRVVVIGTGASAIQLVPAIQPRVGHLTVVQRTAPWILPHRNRAIRPWERALYRRAPFVMRGVRESIYWLREIIGDGLVHNRGVVHLARRLGLAHLRKQVPDRELRKQLRPTFHPFCKRILISNDWYPALQQPNVSVDTSGIERIEGRHVVFRDGQRKEADVIVLGTGFRVVDNPLWHHVFGDDGRSMADHFREDGTRAYNGALVTGFPNLFVLGGPNTGIGHTSLLIMIEAQIHYAVACLEAVRNERADALDVRAEALDAWHHEMREKMQQTVWLSGCDSWYLDDKGDNPATWPDLTYRFVRRLKHVDREAFRFLTRPPR